MLVALMNKHVPDFWPLFKEILRSSIPITPDLQPGWLKDCLYYAMTGQMQWWVCYDPQDEARDFYCGFVTKCLLDDLTGQNALLVYAIQSFKRARREVRREDMRTLARVAKARGVQRITFFCENRIVVNALQKTFPELQQAYYCAVPLENFESRVGE